MRKNRKEKNKGRRGNESHKRRRTRRPKIGEWEGTEGAGEGVETEEEGE